MRTSRARSGPSCSSSTDGRLGSAPPRRWRCSKIQSSSSSSSVSSPATFSASSAAWAAASGRIGSSTRNCRCLPRVSTSSCGRLSATSMNCCGASCQATCGWRTSACTACSLSSASLPPKGNFLSARSTAASCAGRSARLARLASDAGLGLPRPRAPAFCSQGSILRTRPSASVCTSQISRSACAAPPGAAVAPPTGPSATMAFSASRQRSTGAPTGNGRLASATLGGSPNNSAAARRVMAASQGRPAWS